jgi:L-ascorbate metabolism protein UlaG (beta-lactamase superfamily)
MDLGRIFTIDRRPELPAGTIRLTRLNIYSALYIEAREARILVDPSKILPEVAVHLRPDLILVSHESMDHFEAATCLELLRKEDTVLIGSWGVVIALTAHLSADAPEWDRIYPGVPGSRFQLGDVVVNIEASRHCEYAAPILFDIADASTGFRILDLVDSEITPRMIQGGIAPAPDILVVPLGIALAATPAVAWEMVELFRPSTIFANHFTTEGAEFRALASGRYDAEHLNLPEWYEGATLPGPEMRLDPKPEITMFDSSANPDLDRLLPGWIAQPPSEDEILEQLDQDLAPASTSTALYFLALNSCRGQSTPRSATFLHGACDSILAGSDPKLAAAFLLALGATAGSVAESEATMDLGRLKDHLSPADDFLDYWILEAWGRAALNAQHAETVESLIEGVTSDDSLFGVVGVRRKLMWEVHRLVTSGRFWPAVNRILEQGRMDSNPDVRLLTYKILLECFDQVDERETILAAGLADEHEDVLEWAVIAHIYLFDRLDPANRRDARQRLPALLTHSNFHVRSRANVLAELCGGVQ